MFRLADQQAGVARIIVVGCKQCCATAAERAVGIQLHRPNRESAAVADQRAARKPLIEGARIVGDHRVDTNREMLFVDQLTNRADGVRLRSRIMHFGQAVLGDALRRGENALL